jgi:hypothetical protein
VLHERSKKAIGHSVQSVSIYLHRPRYLTLQRFGAAFPARNSRTTDNEVIANLATFVFKYRPIGKLPFPSQSDYLPRAEVTAAPTEVVDPTADDDDAAEIKQLEASRRVLCYRSINILYQ